MKKNNFPSAVCVVSALLMLTSCNQHNSSHIRTRTDDITVGPDIPDFYFNHYYLDFFEVLRQSENGNFELVNKITPFSNYQFFVCGGVILNRETAAVAIYYSQFNENSDEWMNENTFYQVDYYLGDERVDGYYARLIDGALTITQITNLKSSYPSICQFDTIMNHNFYLDDALYRQKDWPNHGVSTVIDDRQCTRYDFEYDDGHNYEIYVDEEYDVTIQKHLIPQSPNFGESFTEYIKLFDDELPHYIAAKEIYNA